MHRSRLMPRLVCLTAAGWCLMLAAARGQSPTSAPMVDAEQISRTTGHYNPAARYFGGVAIQLPPARRTAPPLPAVRQPTSSPQPAPARSKPFASAMLGPSVTPYLSLDLRESGALPNYYAFVRPQLQQQRQLEQQQARFRSLQQQIRSGGGATGYTARFQNYGGYFPGR